MTIDLQREFYNERWQGFEYANRLKLARCVAILQALKETKLYEPRILDLGCGSGWLTGILASFGPTIGVELADEAVKIASSRYPNAHFIATDIFAWDTPQEEFDVVISQEVIEHVENQRQYIEIACHLLKTGGYLILTTPNPKTFNAMSEKMRSQWSTQPIENWIPHSEFENLVPPGHTIIKLTTIVPGYGAKGLYRWINSPRVKRLLRWFNLEKTYESLILAFGYGLHTLLVVQKQTKSSFRRI